MTVYPLVLTGSYEAYKTGNEFVKVLVTVRPAYCFSTSNPLESIWMILKLEEGLKEVGFTKDTILMVMTVLAGKTLVDMLVRSKYWTELIDKGNTGQLWNGFTVVLV